MNSKNIWLSIIGIAGIGCLLFGVYMRFFSSTQIESQSFNQSKSSQNLTIPINQFISNGWDYGPTVEYARQPTPIGVWIGGAGEIIYYTSLDSAPNDSMKLTAILSSELHRDRTKVIGDGTSDVELIVNGKSVAKQNVMRDNDRYGEPYSWKVPVGFLRQGRNEIAFRVIGGKANGLNVWIVGSNGGVQLE